MINNRLIIEMPLKQIWTDTENINAVRNRYLDSNKIKDLLNKYPVEFAVANIGDKIKWIGIDKCYDFWKSEVQKHIADDIDKINLDNYPGNYAYIASEWTGEIHGPIILLEKIH